MKWLFHDQRRDVSDKAEWGMSDKVVDIYMYNTWKKITLK